MKQIITYLSFNGNCRQAMEFYQQCLGGELYLQTVGESPMSEELPATMKECVLHAHLQHEHFQLMGTDMVNDEQLQKGNAVAIMIDCNSETEMEELFQLLIREGRMDFPIEKTFREDLIGGLTDKFGIRWILHYVTEDQFEEVNS